MTSARLPKCARLKKRPEYRRVYDSGRRVSGRFFLCFFLKRGATPGADPAGPRLGITVTVKVGKATRRNRLKRVTREFFRRRRLALNGRFDVVVNARPQATAQTSRALWDDLDHIFKKAGVGPKRSTTPDGAQ